MPAPLLVVSPHGDPILQRDVHAVARLDTVEVDKIIELHKRDVDAQVVQQMGIAHNLHYQPRMREARTRYLTFSFTYRILASLKMWLS